MDKKIATPASKGLIISLALIVFAIITVVLKQESNAALSAIPMLILLAGTAWSAMQYSKQMDGNVTFGNLFSHGFKTGALVAGIMGLWIAVSLSFIFPEALDRMLEMTREQLVKDGKMSTDEIDTTLATYKKGAPVFATISTVILYLIIGAIGSLIGAAISKKNQAPHPFQENH